MKLVIIGGGASGLMLASILRSKNANLDITIVEKLEHIGKKILMTGNGKCNLSNKNIKEACFNNEFGFNVASSFNVEKYFNETENSLCIFGNYLVFVGIMSLR